MGSGVATETALEERPASLVLVAGFASIARVTAMRFPWLPAEWLVTERFDSLARIGRIDCPMLLVHGLADTTVPARNSMLLHAARPTAALMLLPGVGHDAVWRPAAQRPITAWLSRLR